MQLSKAGMWNPEKRPSQPHPEHFALILVRLKQLRAVGNNVHGVRRKETDLFRHMPRCCQPMFAVDAAVPFTLSREKTSKNVEGVLAILVRAERLTAARR